MKHYTMYRMYSLCMSEQAVHAACTEWTTHAECTEWTTHVECTEWTIHAECTEWTVPAAPRHTAHSPPDTAAIQLLHVTDLTTNQQLKLFGLSKEGG
jgi:hypothetical protein